MSDVEHTAEDSGDTCTAMMHIDPDDSVWKNRALRIAELMRDKWTGRNERGFLQFKGTYFNANKVDPSPKRACDTVYHPRAVQPALLYWQRTGDEELGKLFRDWMDTWVDAAAREERGKPAGVIPSAIYWPDGHVGGTGDKWWNPMGRSALYDWPSAMRMMTSTLLLTSHMTGDQKYLAPIKSMADIRTAFLDNPPADPIITGSAAWCVQRMGGFLSDTLSKYRLLTGDKQFDRLLMSDASGYVRFRITGDSKPLIQSLLASAGAFRMNREGYTSEVRWTDRVFTFHRKYSNYYADPPLGTPKTNSLYSSATGDFGNPLYFPMNAVRWKTIPQDIAALVTDSGKRRFSAELYHFGDESREMGAELYLLDGGDYEWSLTADGGKPEELARGRIKVVEQRTLLRFILPSRRLCRLQVRHLETSNNGDGN